jgi:hypothetical protein
VASSADKETQLASVEQLRREVVQLREALEESEASLERLRSLYDMERYRVPDKVQLFGKPVPLERRDVWERMDREFLILVHDIPQVLLYMKRANRYFPMIEERLKDRGLPDDLKYVAIAESALKPKAKSWAGAVGLWQFIPSTGTRYRLSRNTWVDERRDPMESTVAALNYLEDLYGMFGNWFLAVAAYNTGEARVKRELRRQRVTSYFDLSLPRETERYVFRIAAIKAILSDAKTYGFDPDPDELYDSFDVEPLEVDVKNGTLHLISLARACGITYRSLLNLNPHFRRAILPEGRYTVYVPSEKQGQASSFVQRVVQGDAPQTASIDGKDVIVHKVKSGETLGEIAQKYRVYVKSIKQWNHLRDANRIFPGQRLTIYK